MNSLKSITLAALTAVALIVGAGSAAPASAATGADSGSGAGTLTAHGRGFARFVGDGHIVINGAGALLIRPSDGDDTWTVNGKGTKRVTPSGDIVFTGFKGTAEITGTNVIVSLDGVNIDLNVEGSGKYTLRGRGVYDANNSLNHSWRGAELVLK